MVTSSTVLSPLRFVNVNLITDKENSRENVTETSLYVLSIQHLKPTTVRRFSSSYEKQIYGLHGLCNYFCKTEINM